MSVQSVPESGRCRVDEGWPRHSMDEETPPASARQEPTQPGEKRPVTGPQRRAVHLTAEHRHLMAKHDDFDGQLAIVTPKEPDQLENPDERRVQKGQRHNQVWSSSRYRRKSR